MNKIRINFSKISFISLLCAAVLLLLGNLRVWAHIPLPMITFGKIQKPAYFFIAVLIVTLASIFLGIISLSIATIKKERKGKAFLTSAIIIAVIFLFLAAKICFFFFMPPQINISVFEHGIYQRAPNKIDYKKYKLLKETDSIPAIIGTDFGFKYTIEGKPITRKFPMKMVWVFPEPGMFDSASNKIQKIYSGEITATIGKSRFFGWDLKKNTELIPGLWKMQLWYKEKIICEKCFIVVLPSENKPKAPIY